MLSAINNIQPIQQTVSAQTTLYTVGSGKSARLVFLQVINPSVDTQQTVSVYKNSVADANLLWPKSMAVGFIGEDTQYISDDTPRDLEEGDTIIIVPSGALTVTGTVLEGDA